MPQISQLAATYSSQIFWLLLIFGFVFFAIGLGMFPKVESTVDARDKRISDDLEAAKAASARADRSEEHTSELQSLMRSSYAVFCLQKKLQIPRPNIDYTETTT